MNYDYVIFTHLVKGLSHSRPTNDLEPVDLTDAKKTEVVFAAFAPDWVIHCAAERRPDVAEKVRRPKLH
jgi:S-adenosylmethionine synthetase